MLLLLVFRCGFKRRSKNKKNKNSHKCIFWLCVSICLYAINCKRVAFFIILTFKFCVLFNVYVRITCLTTRRGTKKFFKFFFFLQIGLGRKQSGFGKKQFANFIFYFIFFARKCVWYSNMLFYLLWISTDM
jgi:hypothetical protein